jgi:L-2-hydroxyglutarate oxidase LhgO
MQFKMLTPFLNKPKIYNKKLHDYIVEVNNMYLRKLSERYENNKKTLFLNSDITNFHNVNNTTNNTTNNTINSNKLNNILFFPITSILLASTLMFYLYNLRK